LKKYQVRLLVMGWIKYCLKLQGVATSLQKTNYPLQRENWISIAFLRFAPNWKEQQTLL
jgi:hypothetical protein